MNRQIEEMRNDVQEALKHNSAVDVIRHGLICVNSDGVARELFDDGYRKASDVAREIINEIDDALHKMATEYADVGHPIYFAICEMVHHKVIRPMEKKYESEGVE